MATYKKLVIVWNKDSYLAMPASVSGEISEKKDEFIAAGKMQDMEGYQETDTTATTLYRFDTQEAADEWVAFIDTVATTNELTKISSRIVSVAHAD